MNNLKLSSKMHIMIIISAVIVAIGVAMGLIFQFVSNGYFNYGAEYTSYNSVVVEYAVVEFNDDEAVTELCDTQFKNAGVSYYASTNGDSEFGGQITFRFAKSVDETKIEAAVKAINTELAKNGLSSNASYHELETNLGGSRVFIYGAIALASAIVFQFLYFTIRYKLTMAFSALLADIHNLAIFVSLLSITRIPVGSSVVAFAALTVLITMIGCGFLFDKIRKNSKDEKFAKLDAFEQVDVGATQSLKAIAMVSIVIAVAAAVLFVLLAISSLSVVMIMSPAILALLSAVASIYGTAFFTPAVYSRFKRIGDNYKAAHSNKKAAKNS